MLPCKIGTLYGDKAEQLNIPKDKKSVSLSILIQPEDKSLTDDDLEKLSSKIIDRVFKTFAAEIRSH